MGPTGEDDQIDDPIRIYLMQMGEIPLLSRAEEMAAARQIKRSRRRFRYTMLATDYVLAGGGRACSGTSATGGAGWTARSRSR